VAIESSLLRCFRFCLTGVTDAREVGVPLAASLDIAHGIRNGMGDKIVRAEPAVDRNNRGVPRDALREPPRHFGIYTFGMQ
jgi:hypothetical protein